MSVAFVTAFDLSNPGLRSGVPYYLASGMRQAGIHFYEVRVKDLRSFTDRIKSRLLQLSLRNGEWIDTSFSTATLKSFPRQVQEQLKAGTSLIFSINPHEVAYLETGIPIVLWIDNSFDSFTAYPAMQGLLPRIKREAAAAEKLAFQKAKKVYVASGWLKEQLVQQHEFLRHKIAVLPRGANLAAVPPEPVVLKAIETRLHAYVINLLFFCSGDWHRKGGDKALAIAQAIHASHPVNLVIAGRVAPETEGIFKDYPFVSRQQGIDKSDPVAYECYEQLLLRTHFLVVPSIAEGFGIVYAEAASFGVLSIGLSVMGVTEAIQQGVTGWHFSPETNAATIAAKILEQWDNKAQYAATCTAAFHYAQQHFSWQKNISRLVAENVAESMPAL